MDSLTVGYTIKHIFTFRKICNEEVIYEKKYYRNKSYNYTEDRSTWDFEGLYRSDRLDDRRDDFFHSWREDVNKKMNKAYSMDEIKDLLNLDSLTKDDISEIEQIMNHKILTKYRKMQRDDTNQGKSTDNITLTHIISISYTNI